jgi:hypothetical protein
VERCLACEAVVSGVIYETRRSVVYALYHAGRDDGLGPDLSLQARCLHYRTIERRQGGALCNDITLLATASQARQRSTGWAPLSRKSTSTMWNAKRQTPNTKR